MHFDLMPINLLRRQESTDFGKSDFHEVISMIQTLGVEGRITRYGIRFFPKQDYPLEYSIRKI